MLPFLLRNIVLTFQDNVRMHTARVAMNYFQAFPSVPWPTGFPDHFSTPFIGSFHPRNAPERCKLVLAEREGDAASRWRKQSLPHSWRLFDHEKSYQRMKKHKHIKNKTNKRKETFSFKLMRIIICGRLLCTCKFCHSVVSFHVYDNSFELLTKMSMERYSKFQSIFK